MSYINNYKNLKSINSDFILLSKYFESRIGKYWWFLNSSRIDLSPLGLPSSTIYYKIKSIIKLFYFLFIKVFKKKKNIRIKKNSLFLFEEIQLNIKLKNKEDYYFKNISKKTKIKFLNIIIGTRMYSDNKNISILDLTSLRDALRLFVQSIILYFKYNLIKKKILKKTKNFKFWLNYQKKNSFINFYLTNLTYNYFKNFDCSKNILIYPYEEKPFERAVNIRCNNDNHKNIFAYLINPRDKMALYFNSYSTIKIPRPKNYLFPGKIIAKRFYKNNRKNLINYDKSIVGSIKGVTQPVKIKKNNVFLVLIGNPDEFPVIFDWIKNNFIKFDIKFIFRFFPGADLKKFDRNFRTLKNYEISKNRSLLDDCKLSKYSIFSNTSAGIETVNLGLVSIWVQLNKINISPLDEKERKLFFPSKNKKIFLKNIQKVLKFDDNSYRKKHKLQFNISQNIYSKLNTQSFRNLLNEIKL